MVKAKRVCAGTAFLMLLVATSWGENERVESDPAKRHVERLREGARLVDVLGEFSPAGERFRFYSEERGVTLTVVENLALERISRVLTERRLWSVSGVVTEFRGSNYLSVTRAVLKSRSASKPSFDALKE